MGVRGLQFYSEQVCGEDVCRPVNIKDMAYLHAPTLRIGEKPTIVVDGMGLIRKIYQSSLDWVYGGQWKEYLLLLRSFVECFRDAGIKLVFFFDGPVCPEKRPEWVSRRERKAKDIEAVFEKIKFSCKQPEDKEEFQPPAGTGTLTRFVLKFSFSGVVDVRSTVKEADIEVAEYAKNDKTVFAIMGQDSDFIIFDTKPYISLTHLKLDTLTSVMYDRQQLSSKLNLTISQLPLFSCLLGNDIVPVDIVRPFQRKLCESAGRRGVPIDYVAPVIANIIRRNNWRGDFRDEQELSQVCRLVFGGNHNIQLVRDGIMFYSMIPKESDRKPQEDVILQMHVMCENFPSVYGLHRNLEYDGSEVLEDYTDTTLPPANIAFRKIRQRAYSVLFQDSGKTNFHIKEWCSVPRRDMSQPELVFPLPIQVQGGLPSLEVLWRDRSPRVQLIRMHCFYACLGGALEPKHMNTVRQKYHVFCCILNYLSAFGQIREPLLAPWEVSAFVAQAIHPNAQDPAWLNALLVPQVDSRAVQLATLFMRGVTNMGIVLGICGYPIPLADSMPWNFFNGKLFHIMYLRAKKGAKPEELCEYKAELMEEFHNLLAVIKIGTSLT